MNTEVPDEQPLLAGERHQVKEKQPNDKPEIRPPKQPKPHPNWRLLAREQQAADRWAKRQPERVFPSSAAPPEQFTEVTQALTNFERFLKSQYPDMAATEPEAISHYLGALYWDRQLLPFKDLLVHLNRRHAKLRTKYPNIKPWYELD